MPGKRYYDTESDDYNPSVEIYENTSLMSKSKTKVMKGVRISLKRAYWVVGIVIILGISLIYLFSPKSSKHENSGSIARHLSSHGRNLNSYRVKIVADLDKKSRVNDDKAGKWMSIMKKGELRRGSDGKFSISWLEDQELFSKFAEAGRGMELSALVEYNGHLYTFDDRTGLVFEITSKNLVVPRFILMEGDGNTDKGQKTEWATSKDNLLYAGSFGKEYTNPDGSIKNTNNMWVSVIDRHGIITHEDWTDRFNAMRKAVGVPFPGYMIHESITWSPVMRKWVILPRRVSADAYDENKDEKMGSNTVILASEDFSKIDVKHITPLTPTRGFSDFKFLPFSDDNIIVALKSEENEEMNTQNTYITVFNLNGEVLMEETPIPGNKKYEGLEFYF